MLKNAHACPIHISFSKSSTLRCIHYWYNIDILSYDIELISTIHCRHCRYFFDVNIVDCWHWNVDDVKRELSVHRRYYQHFFDADTVDIVDIAMYTMLNRYWVNIVYIADISLLFTSWAIKRFNVDPMSTRCRSTFRYRRYRLWKEERRHTITTQYRLKVGKHCDIDNVVDINRI